MNKYLNNFADFKRLNLEIPEPEDIEPVEIDNPFNLRVFNPYNIPFKEEQPEEKSKENPEDKPKDLPKFPIKFTQTTSSNPTSMDSKVGYMQEFIDIAKKEGLNFRVTSGYRPGAKTKNGHDSWHSKGLAIDIVPDGVSWEAFKDQFGKSPNSIKWLRDNNFGILDETTPEMLAKTGGTGPHWHIGKDKIAVETFNKWFPQLKRGGVLKYEWGDKVFGTYKIQPGDGLNKIAKDLEIKKDSLLKWNNIPVERADNINIGDTIFYKKDPGFLDNIAQYFKSSDDKKKDATINQRIDTNTYAWEHPEVKKEDPVNIFINFITGNKSHNGWEGFFEKPYLEKGSGRGIWTVGHGHTDPALIKKYSKGITKEQSIQEIKKYVNSKIMPYFNKQTWWKDLDSNMQAALIDAAYNTGINKFKKSPKLLNLLVNKSDTNSIIKEMDWNKNTTNGLGDRSGARRALAAGKYNWKYIPYSNKYVGWNVD